MEVLNVEALKITLQLDDFLVTHFLSSADQLLICIDSNTLGCTVSPCRVHYHYFSRIIACTAQSDRD